MECHKWSGQNVSDFYQEASTCSEVSTFQRIQMKIGETVLTRFVSVFLLVRIRDRDHGTKFNRLLRNSYITSW